MDRFVFVGSYCEIDRGRIKLDRFGQGVTLPVELARVVIQGGGAVIPAEKFEAIGFTAEELKRFAFPGPAESAPEAFKVKRAEAWRQFAELKEGGFNGVQSESE
jgi:hypothetical protein